MNLDVNRIEQKLGYARFEVIEKNGKPTILMCQFLHGPFNSVIFGLSNFSFTEVESEPRVSFELIIIENEDEVDTDSDEFLNSVKMLVEDLLEAMIADL